MKREFCLTITCLCLLGLARAALAQDLGSKAKEFTKSELAMAGLKAARVMVEHDCVGRVAWAQTSLGRSSYAVGHEVLRDEGYNRKEMRRVARHTMMTYEAVFMWVKDAGYTVDENGIVEVDFCEFVEEIAETDHPMGRFLVRM